MSDDMMSKITSNRWCNTLFDISYTHVFTKDLKLGRKTPSKYRSVIYQTKGKGAIYTPVQSDGSSNSVTHDLTTGD